MNIKQQKTYELLVELTDILDKNNFKYSLFYGSLLGAIRHNGFIPWDDDVDIIVEPEAYQFLEKNYSNYFKTSNNSRNFFPFGKFTHDDEDDPDACFVDVFVVIKTNMKNLKWLSSLKNRTRFLKNFTHRKLFDFQWGVKLLRALLWWIKPYKKIYYEEIYQNLYDENGDLFIVLFAPQKLREVLKNVYKQINFDALTTHVFEQKEFKILSNWEEYLLNSYGPNWRIPKRTFVSKHLGLYDLDIFTSKKR